MMYGRDWDVLVGRTLTSASIDGEDLVLRFTDGTKRYRAEGDCCSVSWIEHLTVPDLGRGAVVLRVTESGGVDATPEQQADQDARLKAKGEYGTDCLVVYHTAIATTKGEVVIEYRNDSNGYYGGYLEEVMTEPVIIDGAAVEVIPEARALR